MPLLVQDLGRLLESGEYRRCLEEAFALLKEGGHDAEGAARIHAAICRSRLELTDYFAAVDAGERAVALAEEAGVPDVLGFALVDLGTALSATRRFDGALEVFERFCREVSCFTAARCMEGTVLQRMAATLQRAGSPAEALERFALAERWFQRFGDEASALDCSRAALRIHLDEGEPAKAVPILQAHSQIAAAQPRNRELVSNHLLDRALYHLAVGEYQQSVQEAFQALELADDRLVQQSRAHLLLCQNALATNQPKDALSFALAARVAAIDGKLYDLEFEASEILFRLLRERGARLLKELEVDYQKVGASVFHYLSEQAVDRMLRTN